MVTMYRLCPDDGDADWKRLAIVKASGDFFFEFVACKESVSQKQPGSKILIIQDHTDHFVRYQITHIL